MARSSEQKLRTQETVETIEKSTDLVSKLGLGAAGIMLTITCLLFWLSRVNAKQIIQTKQQIENTKQQSLQLTQASDFLDKNQDVSIIKQVLPQNRQELVDFVSDVEIVGRSKATNFAFKFSALKPTNTNGQVWVPFVINFVTTTPKLIEFLTLLEKMPYLIEVTSVETNTINNSQGVWGVGINAKIYVLDTFDQL